MKLKDIEGLLPNEGDIGIGCERTVEAIGEKELEIDVERVKEICRNTDIVDTDYICHRDLELIAVTIAKEFPVRVKP